MNENMPKRVNLVNETNESESKKGSGENVKTDSGSAENTNSLQVSKLTSSFYNGKFFLMIDLFENKFKTQFQMFLN
jgi:hypothetical protein